MIFKEGITFQEHFIISGEIYENFILLFKDKNPLHTEVDFARSKGFLSCVMHGNILNGFISYFIGECLPVKDVIIHSQTIQFKHPVYLNDELVLRVLVVNVSESVGVVEFKYDFCRGEIVVSKGKIQIGLLK